MESVTVFAGLDYADAFVQVCVLDRAGKQLGNRRVANDGRAVNAYVRRFGTDVHGALEACNGAASLADELVQRAGWSLHLAHPGYVRRMKQNPDKTDYSDARLLADLERVGYLPRVWLAPESIRELRRVVRHRHSLVAQRRQSKQQIGALLRDLRVRRPEGTAWTKRYRLWLKKVPLPPQSRWVIDRKLELMELFEKQIEQCDAHLTELTQDDALIEKLRGQKGIGLVTACTLRAEIGQFDRFRTGKQLARFCGLTPRNASSGERQADAGLIQAGNPELRAVLIEAGHRLARYELQWHELFTRLVAAGKPKCLAIVAVANRWMRWLFHQMVTNVKPIAAA